jgi:hypothetical protein
MARPAARETIAWSRRWRSPMLKWNPRLRLVFVVVSLLALALALGWADAANFLEW